MASNIRRKMPASSTLYINDINAAACTRFQNEYSTLGPIEILSTAREAADNAKVLISIVPAGVDVKKVYLDHETGVIAARKDKDRLMLECRRSPSSPIRHSSHAHRLPITPLRTLPLNPYPHLLTPTLHMLGPPSKFHYLSTLGAGLTAKIANNYLSGTILLATAEALALGTRHGLDPRALYAVIQSSTGQSWMCDHVCPIPNVQTQYWVPSNSGYRPGFRTEMMVKDLDLGVRSAAEVGVEPTMARAALAVWERAAVDERCRGRDGSSVYLHVGGVLPEGYEDLGRKEGGEWVFGE
uniref:3-hydroxyisobutyrate dehydrogenase n=1 Tax=Leptosphaeria maculans TaxID=5022 RepID=Q0QWD5_LEPMC|nr:putative 3-hydroxyisobutyrate dehydrogenase [Plenodomus lingam]